MRRHALAMGAAVLAAVPVVVSPLTVYADWVPPSGDPVYDAYLMWKDELYELGHPDTWPTVISSDAPAYFGVITALVYAVYAGDVANMAPSPGDLSAIGGFYTDSSGVQRYGLMYTNSHSYEMTGTEPPPPVPYIVLEDAVYTIEILPQDGATSNIFKYTHIGAEQTDNTVISGYFIQRVANGYPARLRCTYTVGAGDDVYYGTAFDYMDKTFQQSISHAAIAPTWPGINTVINTTTPIFGSGVTLPALPASDEYSTLTPENVGGYIEEVINPLYPDLENYRFTPSQTSEEPTTEPTTAPTYPVQETWAQEADWPEGNLLPTIPAASYSVDIPEVMTEGAAFWWRCLGVLFDGLGITAIVVGLLALGIVLYFVLR